MRGYFIQLLHPSFDAMHPGCPVHSSAIASGEYRIVFIVRRSWLDWDQNVTVSLRLNSNQYDGRHRPLAFALAF